MREISREWLETAARMYCRNTDAAQSLGITTRSFSWACRRYGIDTPYARQRRALVDCQAQHR